MIRKFGKLAPKFNPKTLKLSRYLSTSIPPPPAKVYREYKVPKSLWGMDANDKIGDCTCAAVAHMLMLVSAHTGAMVTPTEDQVIKMYSDVSGYNPTTGANDNGAYISDTLDYWEKTGLDGHKILGWAQIDHTNITEVRQAIWIFGGIDIGVSITSTAMDEFDVHHSWHNIDPSGMILGGHAIPLFGFGKLGYTCVTWGTTQQIGLEWFDNYCDEAYAVITQDWINQATQKTISGFDLATLQTDLAALATTKKN